MVIFIFIAVVSVLALLNDWYIYRLMTKRHKPSRQFRNFYIAWTIIIDLAILVGISLYRLFSDADSTLGLRVVMLIIGLFFLHVVPKLIVTAFSLIDIIVGRLRKRRLYLFTRIGVALAVVAAAMMIWGLTFGRSLIRVETVELEYANLPESFDGYRVVQFSDNHIGTLVNRDRFLGRFADRINSLKPDLVIHSGDIVNTHERELDDKALAIFSRIKAPDGVISVLGNHDMGIYIGDTVKYPPAENIRNLIRKQESMGWTVLRNSTSLLTKEDDAISVTGLNFPEGLGHGVVNVSAERSELDAIRELIPDSLFNITITHAPQLWNNLLDAGKSDLALAGHVHAMQMKFGLGRFKWSPARFFYDRWSGLYREGDRYLYINDGAGYVMYPMRINARPEITEFILRSKK